MLNRDDLNPDPLLQFKMWLQDTGESEIAMTLATADYQGRPSARIVLLRGVDEQGLVFFTNYESRKGIDLAENPQAALLFYWPHLSRQVRIDGRVEKTRASESDAYFKARPRGNQLQAHASPQSRVIPDRETLQKAFTDLEQTFNSKPVPRPPYWGGYRLCPESFEFWQEGANRMHDRLRYQRDDANTWIIERLSP